MDELTERQHDILMAIVKEFMQYHQEVGSQYLVNTYDLGVSSATVRNEMSKLTELGYLKKSHTSSGRFPTDAAIKLFIEEHLNSVLEIEEEVNLRKEIARYRFVKQKLVDVILKELSTYVNAMSFMFLDESLKYYGISNLMKYEELRDISLLEVVMSLVEDADMLKQIVDRTNNVLRSDKVKILVGDDLGLSSLSECAIAFVSAPFWGTQECTVGVLGSKRLDYQRVVPALNLVRDTIEYSLRGWN